jgi:hypothetical protein
MSRDSGAMTMKPSSSARSNSRRWLSPQPLKPCSMISIGIGVPGLYDFGTNSVPSRPSSDNPNRV